MTKQVLISLINKMLKKINMKYTKIWQENRLQKEKERQWYFMSRKKKL